MPWLTNLQETLRVMRPQRSWRLISVLIILLLLTSTLLVSAQSTDDATAQDGDAVTGDGGATGTVGILAFDDPDNFTLAGRLGVGTDVPAYVIDARDNRNTTTGVRVINSSNGASAASNFYVQTAGTGQGVTLAKFGAGNTGTWSGQPLANRAWLRSDTNVAGLILLTGGNAPLVFGANNLERMRIAPNGFVGIGTAVPNATLDINGNIHIHNTFASDSGGVPTLNVSQQAGGLVGRLISAGTGASLLLKDGTANNDGIQLRNQGGHFSVVVSGGTPALNVISSGLVGINTQSPSLPLHVVAGSNAVAALESTSPNSVLRLLNSGGESNYVQLGNLNGRFGVRVVGGPENGEVFNISRDGNVAIGKIEADAGAMLDVAGTTRTNVLMIDGGMDLAEPFVIADAHTIEPGMVVAIDPDNPGQLRLAAAAYDRTVAGVVSGAGGINPGLILQQEGSVSVGDHPVALTGRVYVYADAANGPIVPGDLLTTADTPGHAMKVTDYARAQGAILGKAMSRLDEGTGLVLVLVTLQ